MKNSKLHSLHGIPFALLDFHSPRPHLGDPPPHLLPLDLPRLLDGFRVRLVLEEQVDVVPPFRDEHDDHRIIEAEPFKDTTAVPGVEQAVGEDDVGQRRRRRRAAAERRDPLATPLARRVERVRGDAKLVEAGVYCRPRVPGGGPEHVSDAILGKGHELLLCMVYKGREKTLREKKK